MSSRYSAARPKRAGEQYARTHHSTSSEAPDGPSKKPKFDIRNPSALAPDAPEEDAVLEADSIGLGAATKRGAVNLDGYDSDSDNEGFDARAEERAREHKKKGGKGEVSIAEAFEYGKDGSGGGGGGGGGKGSEVGEDADMFADLEDENADEDEDETVPGKGKKGKAVTFLDASQITDGEVLSSKSGGHISSNFSLDPKGKLSTHAMDDQESSDDDSVAALAAEEEDLDEEIGAGGLKRNAPKVDAFNMKAEQEEGRFDAAGNFVRKATDPDAKHDAWLDGIGKKDMKKAAEAHEKREADLRERRLADDALLLPDILRTLILRLEKGETVLEALARLAKLQPKTKKIPAWKLKKQKAANGAENMDIDSKLTTNPNQDPEQIRIRETIDAITGAADQLLTRGQTEIYEQEREMLIRQYRRESGEDWIEPPAEEVVEDRGEGGKKMWKYRWIDGRDGDVEQGPFDGETMVAWRDAGYFGEGVEFRRDFGGLAGGGGDGWGRVVDFI